MTDTTLWFAEFDGLPMPGGHITRAEAIHDILGDYDKREWPSLRKSGYSVAKYKLVRVK